MDTRTIINQNIYCEEKYSLLGEKYTKGKVLKTDTWNEVVYKLPIKADYYLEIDNERVLKAKEKGFNAILGDIRKIPFEKEQFDTLIDFSTIDHIEEYEEALKEYNRVIKMNGKLVLVVWLGTKEKQELDWGGYQYYFEEEKFKKDLKKYFKINKIEEFPHQKSEKATLKFFLCKKLWPGNI